MQVLSVCDEHAALGTFAPDHQRNTIAKRQYHHPERTYCWKGAARALCQVDREPTDHETQQHASCITKKCAGLPEEWLAEIHYQESTRRAEQDEQNDVLIPKSTRARDQGERSKCNGAHHSRVAIYAIGHV